MKEQSPKHFRVLVADDNSSMLDLFQQVLYRVETDRTVHLETGESESKLFYENASSQSFQLVDVVTCQQGDEAVDVVKSSLEEGRPFSVAFIDIRMPPGPNGIQTAEHIRALDANVEILIMTGYSDAHPSDITRRVPPVHKLLYFQKPFHIQEIYQFASSLSMKWHTECELQRVNEGLEKCVETRIQEFKKVNEELQIRFIELHQTQLALQKSEKRYRAVVESQTEMICRLFPDGTITFVNDAYCRYFDKGREELIGHKFMPLIPESDRDKVFENMASLNPNTPVITHEHRVLAPNGKICWHKWINRAIFDDKSNLVEYQAVGWDITSRVRVEEALRENEERFRMIFTNSIDGIIVADPATKKFTCVNPAICKALDYTEEKLLQMSVVDIHPKNSLEHVVSEFEAQARGEKLLAMNLPFLKKDGTIIYMDVNASIVKIGEKHRVMGIFRDITERVKAEETLKKSHNELEHRVKERTFELNNALKTIKLSEKELVQRKFTLEKLNKELMETNQALSILARNIDRDKNLLEKKIYEITSTNMIPIINELQGDKSCQKRLADLEVLKTYLNGLIPGPTDQHEILVSLSSQEMRVAAMIKHGLTSPKIAEMLNVSLHTVKTHRKNIRKKLKLQNSNVNLCSYLRSKMVSDSM